jgi:hypothetical protein
MNTESRTFTRGNTTIRYNSDFSGDAIVVVTSEGEVNEFKVPAQDIAAFGINLIRPPTENPKEYWLLQILESLFIYDVTNWPIEEKRLVRLSHNQNLTKRFHEDDYWIGCELLDAFCKKIWCEEEEGVRPTVYDDFYLNSNKSQLQLNGTMYVFEVLDFMEKGEGIQEEPKVNTLLWHKKHQRENN